MTTSLKSRTAELSQPKMQLHTLNHGNAGIEALQKFDTKLNALGLWPLSPTAIDVFQINVGKMCNQVCKHCHVDAGPDRKEIMTKQTMEQCLQLLKQSSATQVDLTGGAPEMNPNFRWFVESIRALEREVIVRCNLTILTANPSYEDLPEFYAKHRVRVVSSLPYYEKRSTDRQRGDGVFERSIEALKRLNNKGYGKPGTGLVLDLVYNPLGAFLPGAQRELEADFRRELLQLFGIEFNQLYAITNMPISRFLEFLVESGNLERYLEKLVNAFNPSAAQGVMCRNLISIGWDGGIYDCDFNQMLEMKVDCPSQHVSQASVKDLSERKIRVDQHCYGCTAGSGSSCQGATA